MELSKRKEILKSHQLKATDCRLDVLEYFISSDFALSQKDLEDKLYQYDRVTLYRTLHSFLESGLVHRIPNDSGMASYGICHDDCTPDAHHDNHLHFKCNECGHIECLEEAKVPKVSLPEGYQVEHTNLIVDGLCESCVQS